MISRAIAKLTTVKHQIGTAQVNVIDIEKIYIPLFSLSEDATSGCEQINPHQQSQRGCYAYMSAGQGQVFTLALAMGAPI